MSKYSYAAGGRTLLSSAGHSIQRMTAEKVFLNPGLGLGGIDFIAPLRSRASRSPNCAAF